MPLNPEELILVIFKIGSDLFAIEVQQIREILRIPDIIRIPNAPPFVEGIINLRGSAVCVLDLHKRFQMAPSTEPKSRRILVIDLKSRSLGLVVDQVHEVLHMPLTDLQGIPSELTSLDARFLKGVAKINDQFVLIIDAEKMFSTEELIKLTSGLEPPA